MRRLSLYLLFIFAVIVPLLAAAESTVTPISYNDHGTELRGYLAVPTDGTNKLHPAILVFHDWMGISEFPKQRAQRLADAGYVAFAADVYGAGVVAKDATEAGALAGKYKADRPLMRSRAVAALKVLSETPGVDKTKIAAIGFCFGGTVALELARSGAPLAGLVSFHGGLDTPTPATVGAIKERLLILHGADDPLVSHEVVDAFEKEMKTAGVNYQLIQYPGAVHAFTNPLAGNDNSKGAAYNAEADRKSYLEMERFFRQIFSPAQ